MWDVVLWDIQPHRRLVLKIVMQMNIKCQNDSTKMDRGMMKGWYVTTDKKEKRRKKVCWSWRKRFRAAVLGRDDGDIEIWSWLLARVQSQPYSLRYALRSLYPLYGFLHLGLCHSIQSQGMKGDAFGIPWAGTIHSSKVHTQTFNAFTAIQQRRVPISFYDER